MKLSELKSSYEILRKKHGLPEFDELNKIFDVERIDKESDLMLRSVRRAMMDKIIEQVRFFEMVLNPGNAPPTLMQLTRRLGVSEMSVIGKIYSSFVEIELDAMKADISYSEELEKKLIMKIFGSWKELASEIDGIVEFMRKNFREKELKKEKSYFG